MNKMKQNTTNETQIHTSYTYFCELSRVLSYILTEYVHVCDFFVKYVLNSEICKIWKNMENKNQFFTIQIR